MTKKEIHPILRLQISMWLGPKCKCLYCKHKYESVEDFVEKDPMNGHNTKTVSFVCKKCYPKYKKGLNA